MERTVDLQLEVDASVERNVELDVEFPGIPTGGTTDHNKLTNRDKVDQHPMSAISGLIEALLGKLSRQELESAILAAIAVARDSGDFNGKPGEKGNDGQTPYIKNGNWWIGSTDTGVKAEGAPGQPGAKGNDGQTPYIKNGNWWIGSTDTGVRAKGADGQPGDKGATFIPAVSADGVISWTNDKGLDNPEPANIKGDPYTLTTADKNAIAASVKASLTSETWDFKMEDGSTETKAVLLA